MNWFCLCLSFLFFSFLITPIHTYANNLIMSKLTISKKCFYSFCVSVCWLGFLFIIFTSLLFLRGSRYYLLDISQLTIHSRGFFSVQCSYTSIVSSSSLVVLSFISLVLVGLPLPKFNGELDRIVCGIRCKF